MSSYYNSFPVGKKGIPTNTEIPKNISKRNVKLFKRKLANILLQNIRQDLKNKEKFVLCLWMERLNIIKMSVHPGLIYKFNVIIIKVLTEFFTELGQIGNE